MHTYQITLKSQGKITQLPDSQKIFGAMIYLLANNLEEEKIDQFIQGVLDNKCIFMVSNLLPKDHPKKYFPVPHGDIENGKKEDYEKLKKKKFVPIQLMNKKISHITDFVKIQENQDAKYRISNEFFNVPGAKNDLFSIPIITPIIEVEENEKNVDYFSFYLAFDVENELTRKLLELLRKLRNDKEVFLHGQKASHGYNMYEIIGIVLKTDLPWDDSTCFLNLGMFLPNDEKIIDYEHSKLKLFTSERRPYEMRPGQGQFERDNNFLSFIEAGSIVKLNSIVKSLDEVKNGLRFIGKSIRSPYGGKRIVYGQSFLYPLKEEPKL